MSTINASVQVQHQETGISFSCNQNRLAANEGFSASQITVTTTEEPVAIECSTPRQVMIRLLSGDDLKIGTVTTVHPFRLSGANDFTVLRLDVEGRSEITTVTAGADTAGSLDGKHLVLREFNDAIVWPWFNMARKASKVLTLTGFPIAAETIVVGGISYLWIATVTASNHVKIGASASESLDFLIAAITGGSGEGTNYGTGTTANTSVTAAAGAGDTMVATALTAGVAGNAIAISEAMTNGSWDGGATLLSGGTDASTAPTVTTERLIQVDITEGATAAAVATALQTALDADFAFNATVSGAVVTITDTNTGTRTAAGAGGTGWAAPTAGGQGVASPTVFLESAGTSQVVIGVAPN